MPPILRPLLLLPLLCTAVLSQKTETVPKETGNVHTAAIDSVSTDATRASGSIDTVTRPPDSLDLISDSASRNPALGRPMQPLGAPSQAAQLPKSSVADSALDSFSISSNVIGGIGLGLSLGSLPILKNWKNGLPSALSDVLPFTRIIDSIADDTISLRFTVKKSPDVYNMMFPLSFSLSRLWQRNRLGASASFAMLSKSFNAAIEVDSQRTFSLEQTMRYYTMLIECTWGTRIPEIYFSVDKVDRTDAIAGIAVSPYIGLRNRVATKLSRPGDPVLETIKDSLTYSARGFKATGVALAWRLGIMALRRISSTGGIETALSYQGLWCTHFKSSGDTFRYGSIDPGADNPDAVVSYFSTRFDITISFIRRLS
jgi:hypothetical protein